MNLVPPFPPSPKARADLKSGVMYAIDGDDSYLYYGQVAPNKQMGFFKFRSREVHVQEALAAPLMSRFCVIHPSIGTALRAGKWLNLGRQELRPELLEEPVLVQWPVGTLTVTLWKGRNVLGTTLVHDPEIQDLEIIAAYDATFHVPSRLRADFCESVEAWAVGGSIRRERLKKQDLAARFPQQPRHQLPTEWVAVQ
ncbi:hypothetical protein PL263_16560 [Methylomonas sp. EFPC3]|uniref:hypothetical protein n=1 Tax=Methylomonas sp. EFPC3 TaxID=3021710 RepID=UPI002415D12F|nr:hypothetical protein [Methylomonas sp. EFPC3]WFP49700.1 hypothetical protein PL263_16560 [Methylomonas sp. EFPC3]